MENAYGIGVRNRYDLFYNDDVDPFEILKQQEEEKERRKTEKNQPKEKSKNVKTGKTISSSVLPKKGKEVTPTISPKSTETTETSSKPRNRTFGDRNKAAVDEPRENEERKNFRNREDQPISAEQRDRSDGEYNRGGFRGRGGGFRGRGRGRGRGGGGMFSNFEGRKRDFDRHSGSDRTGVRHVDKRDGAGSNNWGSNKDEYYPHQTADVGDTWDDVKEELDRSPVKKDQPADDDPWGEVNQGFDNQPHIPPEEPTAPVADDTSAENTESKENVPIVEETPEETAAREMTLDEWKREQEAKRAVPKFNLRKPGEGEDSSQWKKLYMLKKKAKEDDDDEEEEDDDAEDEEFGRRGRHRQLVDIQINFSDSRRGRGRGRGGRGTGPRGGGASREDRNRDVGPGGMGGGRTNRGPSKIGKTSQQSAPRVDDWNDFPSLVTA